MKVTTLKYQMVNGLPVFTAEKVTDISESRIKKFQQSFTELNKRRRIIRSRNSRITKDAVAARFI
jgi:hypothetical protein